MLTQTTFAAPSQPHYINIGDDAASVPLYRRKWFQVLAVLTATGLVIVVAERYLASSHKRAKKHSDKRLNLSMHRREAQRSAKVRRQRYG